LTTKLFRAWAFEDQNMNFFYHHRNFTLYSSSNKSKENDNDKQETGAEFLDSRKPVHDYSIIYTALCGPVVCRGTVLTVQGFLLAVKDCLSTCRC
jgi:hypothetical protein